MTTKEIKIGVPQGYEIDKEKSTFEKIVFKKKEVGFEHFDFAGAFIDDDSRVIPVSLFSKSTLSINAYKNIWISTDHAKASLAMSQLSVLMASPTYNGDWVADWENREMKYCICFIMNRIISNWTYTESNFLSFKTDDARDRFLENHRGLIIEAKILL